MISRSLARFLVRRPKTVLLVFTIITVLVGLQMRNLYMQSDLATYLPSNDPVIEQWTVLNREFQIGSTIIVYVEADDIRDPLVLQEMDRVATRVDTYSLDHGALDGVVSVTSLASLIKEEHAKPPLLEGLGGEGLDEVPTDPALITTYLARVQSAKGTLFLDSYKVGVIVFQISENADQEKILQAVHEAISKNAHYSDMTVTGSLAVKQAMQEQTSRSLLIVFVVALVLVMVNIYLFHRNLKSFVIAFLPLGFSLVLTFGILGLVHPELTILTIAAVALLIGLGDDYSVYLSSRFAEEATETDQVKRVESMLQMTGKAVVLCCLATVIGFGSLMTSNMPPIIAFGFVCLLGTMLVFISAMILVPCLCILLHYECHETSHRWHRFSHFVVDQRKRLFVIGCVFVVLSLLVLPQVKTDVNYLSMSPQNIPEVQKLLEYSQKFGRGANFNALLVETESQGLTNPETIDAIYSLEDRIRAAGGSAYSIVDELKKYNEVFDRNTLLRNITALAGVNTIIFDKIAEKGLVDVDCSKTLILVSFPAQFSIGQLEAAVARINALAATADLPGDGRVSILVGQDAVTVAVNEQIMGTQMTSLLTELLLILACLIIGFSSVKVGMLSIIPVLFVLAWEPGSLVMLNIPLSVVNITVAAIVISTGIDYGIIITHRLKEERVKGRSKIESLKATLETSGLSIVTASSTTMVALIATFFVDIPMLQQFSIIVIVLYLLALVACFCILPTIYASKWFR